MEFFKSLAAEDLSRVEIAVKLQKSRWGEATGDYERMVRMLPHLGPADLDAILAEIDNRKVVIKQEREQAQQKIKDEQDARNRNELRESTGFQQLLRDIWDLEQAMIASKNTQLEVVFPVKLKLRASMSAASAGTYFFRNLLGAIDPSEEVFGMYEVDGMEAVVENLDGPLTLGESQIHNLNVILEEKRNDAFESHEQKRIDAFEKLMPDIEARATHFAARCFALQQRIDAYKEAGIEVAETYREFCADKKYPL